MTIYGSLKVCCARQCLGVDRKLLARQLQKGARGGTAWNTTCSVGRHALHGGSGGRQLSGPSFGRPQRDLARRPQRQPRSSASQVSCYPLSLSTLNTFVFKAWHKALAIVLLAGFCQLAPAQVSDGTGLTPLEGVLPITDDRALWDAVKDSRDVKELQVYINRDCPLEIFMPI